MKDRSWRDELRDALLAMVLGAACAAALVGAMVLSSGAYR